MSTFDAVDDVLRSGVGTAYPGAACAIVSDEDVVHVATVGHAKIIDGRREVTEHTIFDVASLTKVVATTSAAMILHAAGRLPLDESVSTLIGAPVAGGREITVRRLLAHAAGLPAWRPFYLETRHLSSEPLARRREIMRRARASEPAYPADARSIYSDVGFIILADVIERLVEERLDHWCLRRVFDPLAMSDTFFALSDGPLQRMVTEFAATEDLPGEGLLIGRVHDDNARAMGGVSGHAGLFSTVGDLARFAQAILSAWHGSSNVFDATVVRDFATRYAHPEGTTRCLGWDSPSETGSSAGSRFAPTSIGHLGYTGCSLWIDPVAEVAVVLLSNRVHPTRANNAIREFRPRLHDAVRSALDR